MPFKGSKNKKFHEHFQLLVEYHQKHGHTKVVPSDDGCESLYRWTSRIRRQGPSKRSTEELQLLHQLNFDWDTKKADFWKEKFERLKEFKEKHGHCRVSSRNYKDQSKDFRELANWVARQRNLFKNKALPVDRYKLLLDLGFEFQLRDFDRGLLAPPPPVPSFAPPDFSKCPTQTLSGRPIRPFDVIFGYETNPLPAGNIMLKDILRDSQLSYWNTETVLKRAFLQSIIVRWLSSGGDFLVVKPKETEPERLEDNDMIIDILELMMKKQEWPEICKKIFGEEPSSSFATKTAAKRKGAKASDKTPAEGGAAAEGLMALAK